MAVTASEAGQEDREAHREHGRVGMEGALARLEADAEAALKAAGGVVAALKQVRVAAQSGALRDVRPALGGAERASEALAGATGAVRAAWDVHEEGFFAGGAFVGELRAPAAAIGLQLHELDDRLCAYSAIVQVLPGERAVLIDRRRERRVRPSVLARQLLALQERPARFRAEAFLFDRWWNPAVERQAEDRSHRLGQVCPVHVYAYVCEDTIEERIDAVLQEKQGLFDRVIDDVSLDLRSLLTQGELFGLFGPVPPT